MKRTIFLVVGIVGLLGVFAQPKPAAFKPGERVAFVGDSITHASRYLAFLQMRLTEKHPENPPEIINCGINGEVAAGAKSRLGWDVLPKKPDRAFVMLGMNDINRDAWKTLSPASPAQAAAREKAVSSYETNMRSLVKELVAKIGPVVLMTPSPYDQYGTFDDKSLLACNDPGLARCADVVRKLGAELNLPVVDLHRPMTELLKKGTYVRLCGGDRVHPGNEGHSIMAALILNACGESSKPFEQLARSMRDDPCAPAAIRYAQALSPYRRLAEYEKVIRSLGGNYADTKACDVLLDKWEVSSRGSSWAEGCRNAVKAFRDLRNRSAALEADVQKTRAELLKAACGSVKRERVVFQWKGESLAHGKGWWCHQCVPTIEKDGWKLVSAGLDPFVTSPVFSLDKPSNLQEVVFRAKTTVSGMGELFYSRPGDRAAPQALATSFQWIGDGEWHTYRIRPLWAGQSKIVSLRIDMPADATVQTTFESVAIVNNATGFKVLGTAVPGVGAAFTVPPLDRTVWANIEWVGDVGGLVKVHEHLHLIGDGKERRYFFDAKSCVSWNANYPRENMRAKWTGKINLFRVLDGRTGLEIPIKDLEICTKKPDLPAELILSHTKQPLELDRAGRPVDIEVGVFNVGTVPAKGVACKIEGLPEGVKIVNAAKAVQLCDLGGGDSVLHRVTVQAEKPCSFTARLTFTGGGIPTAVAEIPVKIEHSLNLPRATDYIPEPKPVKTGPCEVGAFYFLDWARTHHWLKIWRTTPERRPAAGWYSNENPELLDWQIKWAVENGISFYLVDWYGYQGYFETSLKRAKFAKYIQWAIMWCNHTPPPLSDEAHWTRTVEHCIKHVFNQPQYKFVNGMPYVSIWDGSCLERDNGKGGCKRMLDKARAMARAAGYKGIYFQGQCGTSTNDVKRQAYFGFDETTTYHYLGTGGKKPVAFRTSDFADVAASSYDYWKSVHGVGGIDFLPNLSTGWDDRPWHDGSAARGRSVEHFRRICRDARRFAEETGVKRVCLAPLQEWGEGSYAEPNGEFGFGMFEAVRDTFGIQPADGWPLNYTPADIGRGPYPVADEDGGPAKPFAGLQWR